MFINKLTLLIQLYLYLLSMAVMGGDAMGSLVVKMGSGYLYLVLSHRKILSIYLGRLEGAGFFPLRLNAVFFC